MVQLLVAADDSEVHTLALGSGRPTPAGTEVAASFRVFPTRDACLAAGCSGATAVSVVRNRVMKGVQAGASLLFWALDGNVPGTIKYSLYEQREPTRCVVADRVPCVPL